MLDVGDDLWDLEAFAEVGVRVAEADAVPAFLTVADSAAECRGGQGALPEIADTILEAKEIGPVESIWPQPSKQAGEQHADSGASPVIRQ